MAVEGHRSTLGDYFTLQRGTTYKSRLLDQPGPILLGLSTIQRNGGFRTDSLRTYGGESTAKLLVQPGDLYLSLKDVTQSADLLGAVARLPLDHTPGRLTQDTVRLEPRGADVPLDYLYWLLRTPQYRSYCCAHATGTTNLGLARDDFLAFPAPEPTPSQRKIVDTLGTLDEKIELNRRTNETLQAIARALFKSWFVDFDPVRAKSEGRYPDLPPHLADLFSDSFEDSELGAIPKGWRVTCLDETATYLNGLALQKYPPNDSGSLPVIKIAQLRAGNTDGADRASADIPPAYVVEDGDVLFSWSGSLEVEIWCGGRGALNQHLFKVTSIRFPKWFYFLWTRHHLPDFQAIAAGKATTMGHIQRGHLSAARVLMPPPRLVDAMSAQLDPLFGALVARRLQCRALAAVRDTLLPRLTSGKLTSQDEITNLGGRHANEGGIQ